MTFYGLAAQRFEQYCERLRHSPGQSRTAVRTPGEAFVPWMFHPRYATKVLVYYTIEGDKEPEEVPLAWATQHGEVDERRHTYQDQIERVFFFQDAETFFLSSTVSTLEAPKEPPHESQAQASPRRRSDPV